MSRTDAFGLCAIHHACGVGNLEMVKLLISKKADVNSLTPQVRQRHFVSSDRVSVSVDCEECFLHGNRGITFCTSSRTTFIEAAMCWIFLRTPSLTH